MTKINLREFYPWYKEDTYVDVPDEVAETLRAGRRAEHAQKHKIAYHKAYYSLDCDDGIEYSACRMEPSPEALLLQQEQAEALCQALNTLSENLDQFIQRAARYAELKELTPYALRELVKAIYIEAPDKSSGHRRQNIRIAYALIGFIPLEALTKAETA